MKLILALAASSVTAYVAPVAPRAATRVSETKADLEALATNLNPIVGYWDPLNVADTVDGAFYGFDNAGAIAWWRQAEIKHGRVAMAAFVGYCVQANGYHWGTKMTLGGADWPTGSPAEQWDALPAASKWQIILFVGIMELFAESVPPHYMKGGQPGKFPSFAEAYKEGRGFPHPVPFDLYDPFGFSKNRSPEAKARGLLVEINNGRAAMLGIFGFLAESKVSGSVPVLTGLGIPHYDGDYMAPFAANFHIGA
ncbi:chlorophyll A-B binding protein [Aureococcus anophagefferens]|jgi:hypothetical protein|uniref:Uncharacterized protein LHC46 n=2 Tax=Aureococcus anophagefferens TaxID=44056 RepID=F0YAB2_AURAN|nr:hypothetical protein AURANDRAFT_27009 [Aureococcus anophagefferens]EGB08033.1 hypothetical protein AURANDRAFT_27009 [Aureococcus anophagefferens]|eukprot:XP_009037395.1 hypothetical protein AURANDRAFT_27009 [Aureococcus anophagefferens]